MGDANDGWQGDADCCQLFNWRYAHPLKYEGRSLHWKFQVGSGRLSSRLFPYYDKDQLPTEGEHEFILNLPITVELSLTFEDLDDLERKELALRNEFARELESLGAGALATLGHGWIHETAAVVH